MYEHVTGGGLAGEPLPDGLLREADLIVRALLADLAEIPGVEVLGSRDPRLPPLPDVAVLTPRPAESPLELYQRGLAESDAAWPTAPETGGILEELCRQTIARHRILLGSRPEAVRLAASKRATVARLREAGIPAVLTVASPDAVVPLDGPWVVKPDDGAGCEDTVRVPDWLAARERLARGAGRLVAQPWIEGEPASLSLIAANGGGVLLSCNRQRIRIAEGRLVLTGLEVNTRSDAGGRLAGLAARIAAVVPDLWGYVGVDLILGPHDAVVLEVNPRLTTSYTGLRRALAVNVARMVLDLLADGDTLPPSPRGLDAVEVALEATGG